MKRVLILLFILLHGVLLFKPTADISFDSPRYITIAQSIASGNGYRSISEIDNNPVFYNNYVFPYSLSLLIRIFGINPYPLKIFVLIISLLSILLFFNLNLISFNERESFLLSLSLMTMPLFIKFSSNLLTEVPFMLLLLIALWCFKMYMQKDSKKYLSLSVITIYFLIFTRTVGIVLLPLLFIYSYFKKDKKLLIATIILTTTAILTIYTIQSKVALDDRLYHIKYLLYKDAFTPQRGFICIWDLTNRIISNIEFYFISTPKDMLHLPSRGIYIYTMLFWSLLSLGILKIKDSCLKTPTFIFFIIYMSFFIIWPWQSTRFIYPVTFIMIIYLYSGIKYLTLNIPTNTKKIIYLIVVSFIVYSGIKELLIKTTIDRVYPAEFNEIVELSYWIKDNLAQDSVILSDNTALIYMLSSIKGVYIPYSYDIKKITTHLENKGVTHILADRMNSEMARYIYTWINKNKEKLKIVKINGGTVLFELD